MDDAELDRLLQRIPLMERRNVITKITRGGGFTEAEFAASREKASFILDKAERALEAGLYLAGDTYSLADINMVPFIDRYRERVMPKLVTPGRLPRLCDWLERVMARPAVIATFADSAETRAPAA